MLCSVDAWTIAGVEQALEQVVGRGDPADPREQRKAKLVQAATELFVQQGYRQTSVEEVARRAGVAKGTVYLHFKTKGELLAHAVVEEKKRYVARLAPILDEQLAPRERLKLWLQTVLVLAREMPLLSRLLSGDLEILAALDDLPAELMAKSQAFSNDFLGGLIDRAAGPHRWTKLELDDRAAVLSALAYFSALLQSDRVRGHLSIERFAAILADLIVDGIRPVGGTP
jgi:AcrR family transcriptional regulator